MKVTSYSLSPSFVIILFVAMPSPSTTLLAVPLMALTFLYVLYGHIYIEEHEKNLSRQNLASLPEQVSSIELQTCSFTYMVWMWLIIAVAAIRLSSWVSYWRSMGLYYRELASQNEKSFQVLLKMQGNGVFIARKVVSSAKKGSEPSCSTSNEK